jgi:LacI family transcriptional regulator
MVGDRRVTLKDVAAEAGVSVATASAVARGASGGAVRISDETRRRVLAVIDDLGYRPNRAAASLRTQRTGIVGMVVPDLLNPLFPQFIRAAQFRAEVASLHLMVWDAHNNAERERSALDAMLERRPDGVVLVTDHLAVDDVARLLDAGIAVATTDRRLDRPTIDMVSEDLVHTAEKATAHLVELGHRRIAHVAGDLSTVAGAARLAGYRDALDHAGIDLDESLVVGDSFAPKAAERAALALLARDSRPTAIFAANDVLAVSVLQAAARLGISVPGELSVVGIDNTREAQVVTPGLTTMDTQPGEIAKRLIECVLARIQSPSAPPQRELLGGTLVRRSSTTRIGLSTNPVPSESE